MPHNIYLHSALVRTRRIERRRTGAKEEAIKYHALEGAGSLVISAVINVFVMSEFAVGFYGTKEANNVGLFTAGECAAADLFYIHCAFSRETTQR